MNSCNFSDDETIIKAIKEIEKGLTEKEVQKKFNLSEDDLELIEFVMNDF